MCPGQVWLLRPLYALVIARVADAVLFAAIGNALLLSFLPTIPALVIESFRGWPSILIAYLGITALFYFGPPTIPDEAAYWDSLRAVGFLLGLNAWLAATAISRGLLEVSAQALWLNLKDGHFKERVQAAILAMRCMRLLFGTARAAKARAVYRRHMAPTAANVRRAGVSHAVAGVGALAAGAGLALASGIDALGAAIKRRNRLSDPAKSSGSAEPPTRPLPRQARGAELYIEEDALFSSSGSLTELSDQVGLLISALAKRGGFVKSADDARRRAAKTFDALLVEYDHELESARATLEAPPVDGDGPPGTLPRARLIRWCLMATRKHGSAFSRQLVTRMEAVFPAQYISRSDVRACPVRAERAG